MLFRDVAIDLEGHKPADQEQQIAPPCCQAFLLLPQEAPILQWIRSIRFNNVTLSHKIPRAASPMSEIATRLQGTAIDAEYEQHKPEKYGEISEAMGECVHKIMTRLPKHVVSNFQ